MRERVIEQLKRLQHGSVNPQTDWEARNRALLLSQIKNTLPESLSIKSTERILAGFFFFFS